MTPTVAVPYGRYAFSTPDQTYDLDKVLEHYPSAPDSLNFILQYLVMDQWIVQCFLGVHWNTARLAVLQALGASEVPVLVSVIGGVVIEVNEPDVDNAFECGECGYNLCEHGFCACYFFGGVNVSDECQCWNDEGEFVG